MSSTSLAIKNITMQFGGIKAIDDLSFDVQDNQIYGLIGPNGAGKTTIFNIITGNYKPTSGDVEFQQETITETKPNLVVQKGIARTFQNIRLFKSMSVLDNILIGFHNHTSYSYLEAIFRFPRYFWQEKRIKDEAMMILDEFDLRKFADKKATDLSYGDQRKVEIARAIATKPSLLLLDEPAAGMNPSETEDLSNVIHKIKKDFDLTVLLIEHDMKFVNNMCDMVTVLDYGEKIFEGKPADAIVNEKVITAYLGDFTHA
ncbi:MAG: ABC transporter ATP-binding protein [Sulfurovum sp.]|nr:ABC transporter ATP-binding protein [Sulfurovum sp.]